VDCGSDHWLVVDVAGEAGSDQATLVLVGAAAAEVSLAAAAAAWVEAADALDADVELAAADAATPSSLSPDGRILQDPPLFFLNTLF